MTAFELEQRDLRDLAVRLVTVTGELDLTNAADLESAVAAVAAQDGRAVALDLGQVTFVDSAALHVLFRTSRRLGPAAFGLVVPPSSPVWRTLEIVELPKLVPVRASLEELAAALEAAGG